MIDGPNVSAGAYTWILVIIPICLRLRNIVIIQVWFSLIESSRLLYAICGGTAKQECSLVLYGERRNRVGNSFRRRTVVKQTWTQSFLTEDLYRPYCANIGQVICANVAALWLAWEQQKSTVQSYFSSLYTDSMDILRQRWIQRLRLTLMTVGNMYVMKGDVGFPWDEAWVDTRKNYAPLGLGKQV